MRASCCATPAVLRLWTALSFLELSGRYHADYALSNHLPEATQIFRIFVMNSHFYIWHILTIIFVFL